MILRLFRFIGTNDFILRLPAVIFGVLTIPLCYHVGKLFFGPREGLVGAFLMSISWMHIYYSQMVRMYSLLVFLSLSSLFFFYKCFFEGEEKGKRKGRSRSGLERKKILLLVGFVVSTVLGFYTHFFAILIFAVETVFFILIMIIDHFVTRNRSFSIRRAKNKRRKKIFLLFVWSNVAIFLLLSPLIIARMGTALRLAEGNAGDNSVRRLDVSFLVKSFTWFSNTGSVYWSNITDNFALSIYLSLFICGLLLSIRKFRMQIALLSISIALPVLLIFLLSTRMYIQSQPRYLIFILPIYLIIVSRGIVRTAELVSKAVKELWQALITTRLPKQFGVFLVVLSLILIIFSYASTPALIGYYNRPEDENWRGAAQYLENEWQQNDVILLEPVWNIGPFLYYYNTNPSDSVMTPESVAEIKEISKYNRVWYVYPHNYRAAFDSDKEKLSWLRQNSDSVFDAGGIDVFFLSPEEDPLFRAGIFIGYRAETTSAFWTSILSSLRASVRIFDETTAISSSSLSEFDIIFFIDFGRPLGDLERQIIEESVEKGLVVILIGLSPYYLAGGSYDLTSISSWFGAIRFSEAPKEARWKTQFTENATEIMKNIDLDHEYEFFTSSDWSTPTGVTVIPDSVVYAYRIEDQAETIFSHKHGNGTSIFNGARYGYNSEDAETWKMFLQALVQNVIE